MYKNYIFDLYGTLVDIRTDEYKDSLWKDIAKIYSINGAKYKADEQCDWNKGLFIRFTELEARGGKVNNARDKSRQYAEQNVEKILNCRLSRRNAEKLKHGNDDYADNLHCHKVRQYIKAETV